MNGSLPVAELHWLAVEALASGDTVKSVPARFGVSVWCIYDLRLGRTFKHLERPRATVAAHA
jgi:hypothetical protein